jgi:hypothetical protein
MYFIKNLSTEWQYFEPAQGISGVKHHQQSIFSTGTGEKQR